MFKKKADTEKCPPKYVDLAPVDDIGEKSEYITALDAALKNEKVRNIALSGPYGSGKSSIINSYLKHHPKKEKRSIRISMATFVEESADMIAVGEDEIQRGILKQLLYKVEGDKLPQSRYRKIHRIKKRIVFIWLLIIALLYEIGMFVFANERFQGVWEKVSAAGAVLGWPRAVSYVAGGVLALAVLWLISYAIQRLCSRIKISRIQIGNNATLENAGSNSESVFNKNMDEILYFFEETKYRIVFFEDLDRLENARIFIQLRELNTLLNQCDAIQGRVVFVYAVRDDIFTNKDRTKFFEFVIPVIPIINATNSGEIFLQRLKQLPDELKVSISPEFVLDVSPYIGDMRILQNTLNEFITYKETLKAEQGLHLHDENMAALVVFKNLYPKDFADLQNESGLVKNAFTAKQKYIQTKQNALQSRVQELTIQLERADQDHLENCQELKYAMLGRLVDWSLRIIELSIDYYSVNRKEQYMKDDFDFGELAGWESCYVCFLDNQGNTKRETYENFQEIFQPYYERWKNLSVVNERGKEAMQAEVTSLNEKQRSLSRWTMRRCLEEDTATKVLPEEVCANKLLVFMLRKGYINEEYAMYINYFKEETITAGDMNFILSIKNREAVPFDYLITRRKMVVARLQEHEFEQREILNFDIFTYLMEREPDSAKLDKMLQQLANESDTSWDFVDAYFSRTDNKKYFIRRLSFVWDNLWGFIAGIVNLSYERKLEYLRVLLEELNVEEITALNQKNRVTEFFKAHKDILQRLDESPGEKIISVLKALQIVFSDVEVENVDTQVTEYIFANNRYDLNPVMVRRLVHYKNAALVQLLKTQHFTALRELDYKPLLAYVSENMVEYVKSFVLQEKNVDETSESISTLLEELLDQQELALQLIEHQTTGFNGLDECCGEQLEAHKELVQPLWNKLLLLRKTEATWQNVMCYWNQYKLQHELVEFIESTVGLLLKTSHECITDPFMDELIQSDLQEDIFEQIIQAVPHKNMTVELNTIPEGHMAVLIRNRYFEFSVTRYEELKTAYPQHELEYILMNQNEYIALLPELTMQYNLLQALLDDYRLSKVNAQKIFDQYKTEGMPTGILSSALKLKLELTKEQFEIFWRQLDDDHEILMMQYMDLLSLEDFRELLLQMPEPYSKLADSTRRHSENLPHTPDNERLVERLKAVEYLTSSEERMIRNEDGKEVRVIRCRVRHIRE